MYTFSFSVLVQALLLISISAAADHGRYRKTLLLLFAFVGAMATMLFLFVTANVFYLAALLAVIANTCIGSSFVLLNSFLPLLVRFHPHGHEAESSHGVSSDEVLPIGSSKRRWRFFLAADVPAEMPERLACFGRFRL